MVTRINVNKIRVAQVRFIIPQCLNTAIATGLAELRKVYLFKQKALHTFCSDWIFCVTVICLHIYYSTALVNISAAGCST